MFERIRRIWQEEDDEEEAFGPEAESLLRILVRLRELAGAQGGGTNQINPPNLIQTQELHKPLQQKFSLRRDEIRITPTTLEIVFDTQCPCIVSCVKLQESSGEKKEKEKSSSSPPPPLSLSSQQMTFESGNGIKQQFNLPDNWTNGTQLEITIGNPIISSSSSCVDESSIKEENTIISLSRNPVEGETERMSAKILQTFVVTAGGNIMDISEFYTGQHCLICFDHCVDTVCIPCLHLCLCSICAELLRQSSPICPVCRTDIGVLLHIQNPNSSQSQRRSSSLEIGPKVSQQQAPSTTTTTT